MTQRDSLLSGPVISTTVQRVFSYPPLFALLFTGSLVASLFFNGMYIEFFSLSLALLCLLMLAVSWRAYGEALPLCPTARLRYAQLLLERGDTARARDILEDGMRYAYTDDDYILPYFALTA